jgi:hypothetical protein
VRPREDAHSFVVGFAPALYRAAYLLSGDLDIAQDVTHAALARTMRRWRHVMAEDGPEASALTFAIRSLRRRRRRDTSRDLSLNRDEFDARAVARDAMWQQLRSLGPRERLAVVVPALPDEAAGFAAQVGITFDPDQVAFDEDLLYETLLERALAVPVPTDLVPESRRRAAAGQKRRAAIAAGLAAAVAGTALVTGVRGGSSPHLAASGTSGGADVAATRHLLDVAPPSGWVTRGNLASDAAFLTDLKVTFARYQPNLQGGVQVLYAADLPNGRVAAVAGRGEFGETVIQWYAGHVGAPALDLARLQSLPTVAGPEEVTWSLAVPLPDGHAALIVLGSPSLKSAEVSWGPTFTGAGTVTRAYEPLHLDDGVAVADMTGRRPDVVKVRASQPTFGGGLVWSLGKVDRQLDLSTTLQNIGSVDESPVLDALALLAGVTGIDSLKGVSWRAVHQEADLAVIRATVNGGDFQVVVSEGASFVWLLPAGTPDLPVAWLQPSGQGFDVRVLGDGAVSSAEIRNGKKVILARGISPSGVTALTGAWPSDDYTVRDHLELRLLDSAGKVLLSRPISELRGGVPTDTPQ